MRVQKIRYITRGYSLLFSVKKILKVMKNLIWPIDLLFMSSFDYQSTYDHMSRMLNEVYHFTKRVHLYDIPLVTQTKPYCFPTVFQRFISVDFQLSILTYWNQTKITLEKTFMPPFKNPTFHTENQPFWYVGNTFFNSCCVTRDNYDRGPQKCSNLFTIHSQSTRVRF